MDTPNLLFTCFKAVNSAYKLAPTLSHNYICICTTHVSLPHQYYEGYHILLYAHTQAEGSGKNDPIITVILPTGRNCVRQFIWIGKGYKNSIDFNDAY